MQIAPSLEQVRALAADRQYTVVPVSTEILSDFITPIEALRVLKATSSQLLPAGVRTS